MRWRVCFLFLKEGTWVEDIMMRNACLVAYRIQLMAIASNTLGTRLFMLNSLCS